VALEVKTFGDPVLKTRASRVKEFDGALLRLTEEMLVTMREREGVGLAANQVGRLRRVLVAGIEEDEYVLVNPVIEARSEETEVLAEGCLSIPGIQVEVERPVAVTVSGQDAAGGEVRFEAEGLLARVFQHEIDHLDGVLILDRTGRETRKAALREWRERLLAQNA
jgi:peptide deformylase